VALQTRYGSVMERYENITEPLWNVAEHYGTLQSVAGRCGTLWNVTEALQIVTERYGSVTGPLRGVTDVLQKRYRALWSVTEPLRNVTKLLRKISILPSLNYILNFAHH